MSDFDHKASRKFNTLVETIGKRHPAFIEEEEKDEEAQPPPRPYGSKSPAAWQVDSGPAMICLRKFQYELSV